LVFVSSTAFLIIVCFLFNWVGAWVVMLLCNFVYYCFISS